MKEIQVVAGIISNEEGKILIAKRKKELSDGGKWEFPGGKVEKNESHKQTLYREIKEELGIEIVVEELFVITDAIKINCRIILHSYFAKYISGTIILKDHDELKWVSIKEMKNFIFSEADIKVVKNFKFVNNYLLLY
jgi:8-oxo-dGTP diphosphatase